MRRDDPLATLLMLDGLADAAGVDVNAGLRRKTEHDLDAMEKALDHPGPKPKFPYLTALSRFSMSARLTGAALLRAEAIARRVWTASGANKTQVEEWLLLAVGHSAQPSSVDFLRDAIAFSRPRDTLIPRRRRWAVAALGFIAAKTGDEGAKTALVELLGHDDPRVRTWVVCALARVLRTKDDRLTAEAVERFWSVARGDRAFEPRCAARQWLHVDRRKVAAEPAGGVYAFKASLGKASRVVEVKSEHLLGDLAWAIVGAFGWDDDHLHEFTLSPELASDLGDLVDDQGLPLMVIGALGVTAGHKFTLLYDFGDHNVFDVQLVEVRPKSSGGAKYPRVASSVGRAPEQYR